MLRTNYPLRTNTVDHEAIKRRAFLDQDILVVAIDHPRLSWEQREFLRQIGERIYGGNQATA